MDPQPPDPPESRALPDDARPAAAGDLAGEKSFRALPEALLHVRFPDGPVLGCNPAAEDLTGYSRKQLVGRPLAALFADGEQAGEFRRRCRMYLDRDETARVSFPVRRADGRIQPAEHVATPLPGEDDAGGFELLLLVRGVSDEEARWAQLTRQLSYFREGVRHIEEVFWLTPPDKSEMLYVSPAYETVMGRTPRSLYENPGAWLEAVHPEDRPQVREKLPLQRAGEYDEEFRIVRPDGEVRWLHDRAYPISDGEGEVVRIVGVASDVTDRKRAEQKLSEAHDLVDAVVRATTDAVFVKDREGRFRFVNEAAARMMGRDGPDELEGLRDAEVFDAETTERVRRNDRRIMQTGETARLEEPLTRADGEERVYETVLAPYRDAEGDVSGVIGLARDVTRRKRAAEELERARQKYETVFEVTPLALSIATLEEGRFLEINEGFERLYGYGREDVVGRTAEELDVWVDDDDRARMVLELKETGAVSDAEVQLRTASGEIVDALFSARRLTLDGRDCAVAAVHDITDRIAAERELERLALHDPLTGLYNRSVFRDRLEHALERAPREGTGVAVLFLDIDRFKVINDSLGHSVGDGVLREAGRRLGTSVRDADTAARVGGDEFAVLLEGVEDREEVEAAAARVARAFEEPFRVEGTEIPADVSIGVAVSREEGADQAEDLLRFSDIAMYRMKESAGTGYRVFDPSTDRAETVGFQRERDLERALSRDELELRFQPVVNLRDERIVAAEALVRWRHPERGLLPPAEFVPFAEDVGLIHEIDRWVLDRACRTASGWPDREPRIRVSVNLSAGRYQDPDLDLDGEVRAVLESAGLPPECLQLEVTESTLTSGSGELQDLRSAGVRVAIDDFGTGYSSLNSLKRLRADALKVDRSFVAGLGADPRDSAIVEAVLLLGRQMDLEVVAEGIETQAQLDRLRELGCRYGQGYFTGRPVTGEDFDELVRG